MATKLGFAGSVPVKMTVPVSVDSVTISSTSLLAFGDAFEVPVNGMVGAWIQWTKGSGTTLTVKVYVSGDGETFFPLPSYGAPTSGAAVASVASLTFSQATWIRDGSSTICDIPVAVNVGPWPFVRIYVSSNNGSGSVEGQVWAGVIS